MGISSVSNYYSDQAYNLAFNTLNGKMNSNNTSNMPTGTLRALQEEYSGTTNSSSMVSVLSGLLQGMGLSSNDSVSFQDLLTYRDSLRQDFEDETKSGLRKLGVDENVEFKVVSDGNGGVKIITNSQDKSKIEAFFAENPNLVKKFAQIESLTNVEAARKSQHIDVSAVRQRIQVESMTAWFAGTGQSVNSILNFSNAETSLLAGLNKKI